MKLTPKQELFIQEYDKANKDVTAEWIIKGIIVLYLLSDTESSKRYSAWMICRIKPNIKLIGIDKLLDMKEVYKLAQSKQAEIQKLTRFAQERRHEKRKDFALTDDEWVNAVEYFDNECAYCGDKTHKLTYDHFIPFSKGGSFTKENLIPCCQKCNSSKTNKEFKEWYSGRDHYSIDRENKVINYLKTI